ncbi:MAG: ParA family protein [Proteobacteria bacterium]|nr:ParA family protein [Pseudomonadota bacterium]
MTTHTPPTIIAFASPKGGVGKSTACLSIAGALAHMGHKVQIIDFDQTQTLWRWYATNDAARNIPGLTVEQGPQGDISSFVEDVYYKRDGYVLIDLAGTLTNQMLHLAVFANLTITPAQLSEPDILEANKLSVQLQEIGVRIGKPIVHRVLLNTVPFILASSQAYMLEQIDANGIARFETLMHYRPAYSESFLTGVPPHFADRGRPPMAKAAQELDSIVNEVLFAISQDQQKAAA